MGLHTYCIVPAGRAPAADLRGVADAPVRLVGAAGLGVWASLNDSAPAASLDAVRAHSNVVGSAMDRRTTPVPIRFGQWFEGQSALVERIAADRERWVACLARFAGRAEYGVAVSVRDADAARDVHPPPASTGTAYMQRLARRQAEAVARRQQAGEIASEIERRLTGLDVEVRVETPPAGRVIARVANLVAWTDAEAYHVVMHELSESRPDVGLHLTGPWPPWSFVE